MSTVTLGHLKAGIGESGLIKADDPMLIPGCMTQYKYVRSDFRTTYTAPIGNVDTLISALAITITPRKVGDIIHCQWTIMGEIHHETGFRVAVNGVVPADGYNTEAGNVQWSMIAAPFYDADANSTPITLPLTYIFVASSLNALTITPTVRGSGATPYTFSLNRSLGQIGTTNYENGVSFGYIMEIVQ